MSVYKRLRAVALATLAAVFLTFVPLSVSGLLGGVEYGKKTENHGK